MKRPERTVDRQAKSGTILHYRLVGNERKKVSVTPKHPANDNCASCRLDEVIRVIGSQNVGA